MRSIFYGRRILRQTEIVSDRKKKLTFKLFFYFFLRHSKKFGDFFTKLVGFVLKNHQNLSKITRISRRQPASKFLFLSFFLWQKKKNLCRDPSPIEYTAWALRITKYFHQISQSAYSWLNFDLFTPNSCHPQTTQDIGTEKSVWSIKMSLSFVRYS